MGFRIIYSTKMEERYQWIPIIRQLVVTTNSIHGGETYVEALEGKGLDSR